MADRSDKSFQQGTFFSENTGGGGQGRVNKGVEEAQRLYCYRVAYNGHPLTRSIVAQQSVSHRPVAGLRLKKI